MSSRKPSRSPRNHSPEMPLLALSRHLQEPRGSIYRAVDRGELPAREVDGRLVVEVEAALMWSARRRPFRYVRRTTGTSSR